MSSVSACISQVLAEETFSYSSVSTLNAQNGGTGWGNVWWNQNTDVSIPGYNVTSLAPMAYAGFLFQGNQLVGGDNFQSSGRILNRNIAGPFSAYLVDGDGNPGDGSEIGEGNIWLGCMIRKNNSDTQSVEFVLSDTDIYWDHTSNNKISFGFFGTPSTVSSTRYWTLRIQDVNYYLSGVSVSPGATYFFALNIRYNFPSPGTTSVSLFVNPPLTCSSPTLASVSATSTSNLSFKNIGIYGSNGFNGANFDEIRFGVNFCDVISMSSPLPVKWLHVDADREADDRIRIVWKTADETDCDFFEIEESGDGYNWSAVARVDGSGNTNHQEMEYVYLHRSDISSEVSYYRLRQVDFNGNDFYSKTVSVFSAPSVNSTFSYNKQNRRILVRDPSLVELRIYHLVDGLQVMSKQFDNDSEHYLDVGQLLPSCYLVEAISKNGVIVRRKLLLE